MNILPAIDLQGGKVVQLIGGDPSDVGVRSDKSPVAQAEAWHQAGASALHVVDLDAALGGHNQWYHVAKIARSGLPLQFGGGMRSMVDVQRVLEMGVARVIIGTQGVENPEWLRELATIFPGKIMLAIDAFGRDVATKGWTKRTGLDVVELARSLDDAGLAGFLYTNVEKEGRLQGIDEAVIHDLLDAAPNTPVTVSGGISTMADLERLHGLGVHSVVLGMAIYTGRIDLKAAIEAFA